jgi:spermidine/putrescine transport system permease protein
MSENHGLKEDHLETPPKSAAGIRPISGRLGALLLVGSGASYVFVFLFIPLLLTATYSLQGSSYEHLLTTPLYLTVLLRSLRVAVEVTFISLVLGYPVAYYLAKLTSIRRETVVVLLLFPLFISFLVRAFSWFFILGGKGLINYALLGLGVINEPMKFLFTETAIIVGSVNWTLPFMILPIYSSIEKIDNNLIEMSKNLGADDASTFRQITFPLSLPGIASGVMLTFILSFGMYITPAILGGPQQAMIANMISVLFLTMLNFPLGTALSVILTLVTLSIVYVYNRVVGLDKLLEAMG